MRTFVFGVLFFGWPFVNSGPQYVAINPAYQRQLPAQPPYSYQAPQYQYPNPPPKYYPPPLQKPQLTSTTDKREPLRKDPISSVSQRRDFATRFGLTTATTQGRFNPMFKMPSAPEPSLPPPPAAPPRDDSWELNKCTSLELNVVDDILLKATDWAFKRANSFYGT